MHANTYFVKGKLHKTCEDYSWVGRVGDKPYGIVSDGCSSSPDTDIGARLLVRSFSYEIEHNPIDLYALNGTFDNNYPWCNNLRLANSLSRAHQVRKVLGLSSNCLDATLLQLEVFDHHVQVVIRGDGFFVGRHRANSKLLDIYHFDHPANAPEYLNYLADNARHIQYLKEMGSLKNLNIWSAALDQASPIKPSYKRALDEPTFYKEFKLELYDIIAVMSDGVNTFFDSTRTHLSSVYVVQNLMNFKNTAGCFVERRMKRYLKNCQKEGIAHDDDLSMAAIYLGT